MGMAGGTKAGLNGVGGAGWFFWTGLPLALLAAGWGAGCGWLRTEAGFVPGIQGMAAGGALGWLYAQRARFGAEAGWGGAQRFWIWLNATLTWGAANLATASILSAAPLAAPLDWLAEVAGGGGADPLFGLGRVRLFAGNMGGGWWIGFNGLDLLFFFCMGILAFGAALPRAREESRDEEGEGRPHARRFFAAQWAVAGALAATFWIQGGAEPKRAHDVEAFARLRNLEGTYEYADGAQVLGPSGQGGRFAVRAVGGGAVELRSEPEGGYWIALEGDGVDFRGRMHRGNSVLPVRARFSEGGGSATVAGPAYRMGQSLGDRAVEARRSSADE